MIFERVAGLLPHLKIGNIIGKVGQYTLGIYILQVFILELITPRLVQFNEFNSFIVNFILTPIAALIVMAICAGITLMLDAKPLTALLFLGKTQHKSRRENS